MHLMPKLPENVGGDNEPIPITFDHRMLYCRVFCLPSRTGLAKGTRGAVDHRG